LVVVVVGVVVVVAVLNSRAEVRLRRAIRICYLDPPVDSGPFNVNLEFHSTIQKQTVDDKFDCETNLQKHVVHRVIQFHAPFNVFVESDFCSDLFFQSGFSHFVCFNDLRHRFDVLRCRLRFKVSFLSYRMFFSLCFGHVFALVSDVFSNFSRICFALVFALLIRFLRLHAAPAGSA
jgi:hypothetical protein